MVQTELLAMLVKAGHSGTNLYCTSKAGKFQASLGYIPELLTESHTNKQEIGSCHTLGRNLVF